MSITELLEMIKAAMLRRCEDSASALGEFMVSQGRAFAMLASAIVCLVGVVVVHWWYVPLRYVRVYLKDRRQFRELLRRVRSGNCEFYLLREWQQVLDLRVVSYPHCRMYRVFRRAVDRALQRGLYWGGPAH